MDREDEAYKRRYRYERPALKIVTDIKAHLLPAMDEEEGGWILGLILDLLVQVQLDGAEALALTRERDAARAALDAVFTKVDE